MRKLRVAYRALFLATQILFGLLITPFILTHKRAGKRFTNRAVTSWWHNRVADILGLRITVSGTRPGAGAMLVSNHVSWLDITVLGGLTPTDFLSKAEVRRWPLIGWLAARAGTLFIRRGGGEADSISQQIAGRLRAESLLTVFPEGTTTDGSTVRPFFPRLFAAAVDTGAEVIPVALRYHVDGQRDTVAPYTGQQSLIDNLRGLLPREYTSVHVVFGEPIRADRYSRREIARLARESIVAALERPPQLSLDRGESSALTI